MPVNPLKLVEMLKTMSPTRPQGLVLTPKALDIASTLRGGSGATGDLLRQLAGKPGVKAADLGMMFGHLDPAVKRTPLQLAAEAKVPRLFAQRGATRGSINEDARFEALGDLAFETLWSPQFQQRRMSILEHMMEDAASRDPETAQIIGRQRLSEQQMREHLISLGAEPDDVISENLMDQAFDFASAYEDRNDLGLNHDLKGVVWSPQLQGSQRQRDIPATTTAGRGPGDLGDFETVLRTAPLRALSMQNAVKDAHFNNPGNLGHVRGTLVPSESRAYLEELQSDPLEYYTKSGLAVPPELQGIYGKLGKMMVDRAANTPGINTLSFPTAERIADVRPKSEGSLKAFQDIYDRQIPKQVLDPLAQTGAPIDFANGWYNATIPERVQEMIRAGVSPVTQYRRGGQV